MPETDVTKMKVADLKRELKLRGLATTGNKTELQDRLQTALIDGEISLEDTAISSEDALLDEDAVLTDEDESKILGSDENELLQSPTTTPTVSELTSPMDAKSTDAHGDNELASPTSTTSAGKKIVLKRKSSFNASTVIGSAEGGATTTAKENTEPTKTKLIKMSERNPITISGSGDTEQKSAVAAATKVSQLSMQERLELRAKKFGLGANSTAATAGTVTATGAKAANNKIVAPTGEMDEKQIEMLKKRAERFGCVVSSKIAKIDAEEKLLKRKQRFGVADGTSSANSTTTGKGTDVWAEKARLRLERFKNATATGNVATKASTAATDSSDGKIAVAATAVTTASN